ncbi:hypothetical protein [Agrococcus sp. ProA11]|uniref:hypothetical protein n=1 Tax=Agrococcus chionoecetis TaxID=3153752 RepID=UPI003260DF1D
MARRRTYTDEQLADAIAASESWRGCLRELGLVATSSGAMRSLRSRADQLAIDYLHFRGQRRWTDDGLRAAVAASATWSDVAVQLNLGGTSSVAAVKGHAARLGLDVVHLSPQGKTPVAPPQPDVNRLPRAGSLLAAAWYTLCGFDVSWPLEPTCYDLLVSGASGTRRVQVKTTTTRTGKQWKVYLSTSGRERQAYDPDEIDAFFVIDGELRYYEIPIAAVGGLHAIHLGAYAEYRVPEARSAM